VEYYLSSCEVNDRVGKWTPSEPLARLLPFTTGLPVLALQVIPYLNDSVRGININVRNLYNDIGRVFPFFLVVVQDVPSKGGGPSTFTNLFNDLVCPSW